LVEKLKTLALRVEVDTKRLVDLGISLVVRLVGRLASKLQRFSGKLARQMQSILLKLQSDLQERTGDTSEVWRIGSVELSLLRNGQH
jgi:hypothetical protein